MAETKWEDIENILTYGVEQCMRLETKDTPLFLADNALISGACLSNSNTDRHKEQVSHDYTMLTFHTCTLMSSPLLQLLETCFEKVGSPALYLGSGAILSAFSTGRVNSLVIDIGAAGTKLTPVVEGYELKKASVYTTRGGNYLDDLLLQDIQSRTGRQVKPWFECGGKSVHNSGGVSSGTGVAVTPSFREIHVRDVVRDVKQYMCFVPHNPIISPSVLHDPAAQSRFREEELVRRGLAFPAPYELPDGTLVTSGDTICTAPEAIFFPTCSGSSSSIASRKRTRDLMDSTFSDSSSSSDSMEIDTNTAQSSSQYTQGSLMQKLGAKVDAESLTDLVYACVVQADVDVRKDLLASIHIVGGGALIQGLSNRLSTELSGVVPSHMKVRIVDVM